MIEVSITIPKSMTDARPVPQEVFARFEDAAIVLAGGFFLGRDPEGGSRRYLVAIKEDQIPGLADLAMIGGAL